MLTTTPAKPRGWLLIAIVAGATVLGSLTVWVVMRGASGNTPTVDTAVFAAADAAPKQVDAAVAADASTVVADAATEVADAGVPKTVDAAVVDPLVVAMQERRFNDALAICSRVVTADHADECTVAACRTNQTAKAQRWFLQITNATTRRSTQQACRELGIDVMQKVVRPPAQPDAGVVDMCAVNPTLCK